jgi:hypothetical protein
MILNGHGHMSQQRSSPPKIVLLALLTSWLMISWDLIGALHTTHNVAMQLLFVLQFD